MGANMRALISEVEGVDTDEHGLTRTDTDGGTAGAMVFFCGWCHKLLDGNYCSAHGELFCDDKCQMAFEKHFDKDHCGPDPGIRNLVKQYQGSLSS